MIKTFPNHDKTHIVRKFWVSRIHILRQKWYLDRDVICNGRMHTIKFNVTRLLFLVLGLCLSKISWELQFLWNQLQIWNTTWLDTWLWLSVIYRLWVHFVTPTFVNDPVIAKQMSKFHFFLIVIDLESPENCPRLVWFRSSKKPGTSLQK